MNQAMRAAVYYGPGDVRIEPVEGPSAPRAGELVVDVLRAALCGTDSSEWRHGPRLTRPPVVLGHEFVGRVVAVGEGVTTFGIGDRIVSGAGVSCGACEWCLAGRTNLCASYYTLGLQANGGLAERVASPAAICRRVPDRCSDESAAMAQPFAVALHAVRRSGLGRDETCVVIGVGGIGAFIVAAAAARGANPIIAVDINAERLGTARRLGAHETVDATGRELAQVVLEATGGEGAHVVIEASGAAHTPMAALKAARKGGRVLLVGHQSAPREVDLFAFSVREVDLVTTVAHVCDVDLPESLDLLAGSGTGEIVLDRLVPLGAVVDQGLLPLAEGRAHGKIVVDPHG